MAVALTPQQVEALIPLFEWLVQGSGRWTDVRGRSCQNGMVRIRSALAQAAKEYNLEIEGGGPVSETDYGD